MWKIFAPFADKDCHTKNRKKMASLASVGAVALFCWLLHLITLLFFISSRATLLVISNACSVLICSSAFWYARKGYTSLSIFLINIELCIYCVLSVLIIGWEANTQWLLVMAAVPCQITYPLSKTSRRIYTGLLSVTMFVCYYMQSHYVPYYSLFSPRPLDLINIAAVFGGSVLVMYFNTMGNKVAEGYYEQRINHLSTDAYIDSLTGLWNRRYAMEKMHKMISNPETAHFSIAMLDVDFFKNINDNYGHPCGDVVLRRLSETITHHFRSNDIAVRWGGEEFLIILAGADNNSMRPKLENFRKVVQDMVIIDSNHRINITITIGLSEYSEGMKINDAIRQSDVALYYGKNHGRNQVVKYTDIPLKELPEADSVTIQ